MMDHLARIVENPAISHSQAMTLLASLQLASAFDQSNVLWQTLLLSGIGAGSVGWLLGCRMARGLYAVCGLIVGGVGAWVVSQRVGGHGATVLWVTAGSITGFLIGLVLFKVWIGISGALVLAILGPGAVVTWQDTTPPIDLRQIIQRTARDVDGQAQTAEPVWRIVDQQKQSLQAWWVDLPPPTRRTLATTACGGAVLGLIAGLSYPRKTATFVSALTGSLLVLLGLKELLVIHRFPVAQGLPQDPRAMLLLLGLITLLGCLVQWTVLRPKADT